MNERIKELSDIAYKNHLRNNPESSFGRRADYDTKFAELIVEECANLFDKDEMELTLTERTIHKTIKEHFGVEE